MDNNPRPNVPAGPYAPVPGTEQERSPYAPAPYPEIKIGAPPPPKPKAYTGELQPVMHAPSNGQARPVQFGVRTGGSPLQKLVRNKRFKQAAVALVAVGALAAGWLVISSSDGMELRTISNGAYTYQVAFYPEATVVKQDDGFDALKYGSQAILTLAPTASPQISACSQIGPSWKEAVRVEYNGGEVPVCSATAIYYVMFVAAEGENHLISLSYGLDRPKDIKPVLKRIFSSVRVSR